MLPASVWQRFKVGMQIQFCKHYYIPRNKIEGNILYTVHLSFCLSGDSVLSKRTLKEFIMYIYHIYTFSFLPYELKYSENTVVVSPKTIVGIL